MQDSLGIITIGEGLVEFSSEDSLMCGETFSKYFGGDTLCTAVAAHRMGAPAAYIAKIGNDCFGEYLLDAWQLEGLDTSQVKLGQGQNGVYFVARASNRLQNIFYRKKTAATMLCIEDINFDFIKNAKVVYATGFVQSLSLSCNEVVREIFAFAKDNGITVAYCPNFSELVWSQDEAKEAFESISQYIDIMFLNTNTDSMAVFDTDSPDKICDKSSDLAISTTVIRENLKPTYVCADGEIIEIERDSDVRIIDATGSDSSFNGVFLSYYINGFNELECARYASIAANLQIQSVGAIRSLPSKEKVEEIYRSLYG